MHGIEFTPIVRVEPRPLPADIALYYWVSSCTGCEGGVFDLRRIALEQASGSLRADRPLAFFDGESDGRGRYPVTDFAISHSGQEMAASICSAGLCELGAGHPSADAAEHVWVSRDAGSTWSKAGEVLPGAWILEVTETDVLVREWNLWGRRETLESLTDAEWGEMRARLSHLVSDEPEGWESRYRWLVSGETNATPLREPQPPDLGRVRWSHLGYGPGGAVAWVAEAHGDHLLAVVDADGAVGAVFGRDEPTWGSFATDTLLVRHTERQATELPLIAVGAEVIDLTEAAIYEVEGFSLPTGLDIETDQSQEEYYSFIGARPAPLPAEVAGYTPLTWGEPRALPEGFVLYYYAALPCSLCRPLTYDLRRLVIDEGSGGLRQERPLAFFDGMIDFFDFSSLDSGSQKLTSFGISRSGQTMAVTLCHAGRCQVEPVGGTYPTTDGELRLWVSSDGGLTWEDRGLLLPETVVIDATDEDVLLRTWNFWRYAGRKYTEHEHQQMRERLEPLGLDELEPRVYWARWVSTPEMPITLGATPLPPDLGSVRWRRAATLSSELTAWSAYAGGVYLLAIADGNGAVEHVLGSEEPLWGSPSAPNDLVMSPAGLPARDLPSVWIFQSGRSHGLLDLTSLSIHPIDGLSVAVEDGLPEVDCSGGVYLLITARPAPD